MQKPRRMVVAGLIALLGAGLWLLGRGFADEGADPTRTGSTAGQTDAGPAALGTDSAPADLGERATNRDERVALTASTGDAASTGPAIVGRLLDHAGAPIAGARIVCRPQERWDVVLDEDSETVILPLLRARLRALQAAAREAGTGDDGRFRVAPQGDAAAFEVFALARGHAPYQGTARRPRDRDFDMGELRLRPGTVVSGRVVDGTGRPVAGASVQRENPRTEAVDHDDPFDGIWNESNLAAQVARSDGEGRFELAHVRTGAFELVARHPHHPATRLGGLTAVGGDTLTDLLLAFEPATSIRGRVLGAPAGTEGLRVLARRTRPAGAGRAGPMFYDPWSESAERSCTPAADGSFEVRGVRVGQEYEVWLAQRARGFADQRACSAKPRVQGGAVAVDLHYLPGTSVTMRVVDAATGSPIERLAVADLLASGGVQDWSRSLAQRPRAYPDGRVTLANLRPRAKETLQLIIDAVGFATYQRAGIEVPPSGTLDLGTVRLHAVPVVRVTVLAAGDGAPVAGATVSVIQATGGPAGAPAPPLLRAGTKNAKTDAAGRCVLNAPHGAGGQIHVSADGFAPFRTAPLRAADGAAMEQVVRLTRGGSVAVAAVQSDDTPVAQASIQWRGPPPAGTGTARTDAQGRVLLENLPAGEYSFRIGASGGLVESPGIPPVMAPGGGTAREPLEAGWTRATVAEGQRTDLRLVKPETAILTGVVLENGVPLVGATLRLLPATDPAGADWAVFPSMGLRAQTDVQGRYQLKEAPLCEHRLSVAHRQRATSAEVTVRLVPGANTLDIPLESLRVHGVVRDPGGRPIAGATVRAGPPRPSAPASAERNPFEAWLRAEEEAAAGSTQSDSEGRFELAGVGPGRTLVVRATAKDHAPGASSPFQVAAGAAPAEVAVVLTPAGRVRAQVENGPRFVVLHASYARDDPATPEVSTMIANGSGQLEGLRPGPWKLMLRWPGASEPVVRTVEVKAGETVEVRF